MSFSVRLSDSAHASLPGARGLAALEAGEVHLWMAGLEGAMSGIEGSTSTLEASVSDLEPVPGRDAALSLDAWTRLLPDDERERTTRILAPHRRAQFVLGRVMLRTLLDQYLGPASSPLLLEYLPEGKPVLANPHSHLHFSVAHSDDLLTIAFSLSDPVRVDVERIRPIADAGRIAESYFTAGERCWLETPDAGDPDTAFFRLWTSKEAVVKATGGGVSLSWADTEVVPGSWGKSRGFSSEDASPSQWTLLQPAVAPGYALAVAVARESAPLKIFRWNPSEQAPR